jgi:hypothetical protein
MHRCVALAAILAVTLVVTAWAEEKDFSGTWNIDQAVTDAANSPAAPTTSRGGLRSAPTGFPITIRQTRDSFVIERRGGDGSATVTTTYKLDGIERDVKTSQGTAKAKARWDGDKIIIETFRAGQDGSHLPTTSTYAIDEAGILWVETKTPQGTTRRAYKRS